MGRRLDTDLLVGTSEIAARLGTARAQNVRVWLARYEDFPAPVAELVMGKLWYWPEVEAWARRTGRLPPTSDT